MGEGKKTPTWVFSLTVKANSTERVVHEHHKTNRKKLKKQTPVAAVQTVPANANLSVHALG